MQSESASVLEFARMAAVMSLRDRLTSRGLEKDGLRCGAVAILPGEHRLLLMMLNGIRPVPEKRFNFVIR